MDENLFILMTLITRTDKFLFFVKIKNELPGKTIPVYTGPRPTHGIQDFLNIKF